MPESGADPLAPYGWDASLAEAFAPHAADGLLPARITLEYTHIYRVQTTAGEQLARVAGRLRHHAAARADFPAVGDWVAVEPPVHGGEARIHAVLPRKSRFSRRSAGDETEEQVLAANIDAVFLVAGLDRFNVRSLERYLLVARESGAAPVIVVNKADLAQTPEELTRILEEARALGGEVPVHAVSCRQAATLEPLRAHLGFGRTGALLGSSGVGKSTIINRLAGEELLRTQEVREADAKGRHTSTGRQLVLLPGTGVLIDTPGMRELQLWDSGGLAGTFTDIAEIAQGCRFRDCRHRGEPDCAVSAAVAAGGLASRRVESFLKLQAEQEHTRKQQDERALLDEKRRGRIGSKALRKRLDDKRG